MDYLGYKFKQKKHGVLELKTKEDPTVLHIPDTHAPYQHPKTLDFLKMVCDHYQPDIIVHQGDEADNAALSFHPKDPDMPNATREYEQAMIFMHQLYREFPHMLLCVSNHGSLPYRKAFDAGIPSSMMKNYNDLWELPKTWSWHERIVINDVLAIHGEKVGTGRNAAWGAMTKNRMSTIIGHIHAFGGVTYSEDPFRQIFAANAGCLIDLHSPAMRYGSKYANKGTLGCVVRQGPNAQFVRLEE